MPTGETTWQYYDGKSWAERALTVTELTEAEAAAETEKLLQSSRAVPIKQGSACGARLCLLVCCACLSAVPVCLIVALG